MASILIIDDDLEILQVYSEILEREGYDVLAASDGREGMRLCRNRHVDLVITDIIMPEKEGLETIIELRRDLPHVKIIAMSGGGQIGAEQYLPLAEKLGAQHTLDKPFTAVELLEAISEVLDNPAETSLTGLPQR
jgi:CheY-like chemotaxis protein